MEVSVIARRWCNLVEREYDLTSQHSRLKQTKEICQRILEILPLAESELEDLREKTTSLAVVAAVGCLTQAFAQLKETIKTAMINSKTTVIGNEESLEKALSRRLRWLCEIPCDENGQPQEESLPFIAIALRDACARRTRTQLSATTG